MGICKVDKVFRRIDLKVYPQSQYGYALLYFTGSAQFNKIMRVKALQYGYSLSDAGIKWVGNAKHTCKAKIAESLKRLKQNTNPSEKQIIEAFGMNYLTPEERDIFLPYIEE